jgi:hypothetical protein
MIWRCSGVAEFVTGRAPGRKSRVFPSYFSKHLGWTAQMPAVKPASRRVRVNAIAQQPHGCKLLVKI